MTCETCEPPGSIKEPPLGPAPSGKLIKVIKCQIEEELRQVKDRLQQRAVARELRGARAAPGPSRGASLRGRGFQDADEREEATLLTDRFLGSETCVLKASKQLH